MQKKQSIIRKANTIGMLLMNLSTPRIRVHSSSNKRNPQAEEPWQGCNRELHINFLEVIIENG